MSNGEAPTPPTYEEIIYQASTSPRRISVDGVDYSGHSLTELIAVRQDAKDKDADVAVCSGFRRVIRQQISPPSALGVHVPSTWTGGRIW